MSTKTVIPIDTSSQFQNNYRVTSPQTQTNLGVEDHNWNRQPEIANQTKITWEKIYPSEEIIDPKIVTAQRLLTEIIKRFEAASQETDSDPITADDFVQSTQPLLRELFCCRSIGEGFALIINALSISL